MAAPIECISMACDSTACNFKPVKFQRRALGPDDVRIDMKYCGVCHSDVVWASGQAGLIMGNPVFPATPGHELAGVCSEVGSAVTKIRVGDHVGVGCMVDSCLSCSKCKRGDENWCTRQTTFTYGGKDKHGRAGTAGLPQTRGGYCDTMVVHEHFAVLIPKSYPLEKAGPIMCAGITMYEPMVAHGATHGTRVGIVGLGGLGLIGIKIAKALGCHVVGLSRGEGKLPLATGAGADGYIATSNTGQLEAAFGTLDLIIDTIPVNHDYTVYTPLLSERGRLVLIGITAAFGAAFTVDKLMCGGCPVTISGIGGMKHTQEIMDLCDEHKIYPETKLVPCSELNKVFELQEAGNDAGLRYVLDIANTLHMEVSCSEPPKMGHCGGGTGLSVGKVTMEVLKMMWQQCLCRCSRRRPAARSSAGRPLVQESS